jgi:hypothetical protein
MPLFQALPVSALPANATARDQQKWMTVLRPIAR